MCDNKIIVELRVIPNSSKNELITSEDGSLKLKITTPPVDGKANKAVVEFLSKYYKRPKSAIKIIRGLTSKNKIIEIVM